MTMLRDRPVWTTNLSATLIGFGMFASFVLIPQFVETPTSTSYGFGASVTEAGLFLLPATVAMLLAGPIAGKLSVTVGSRVPLALGALVSSLAWAMLAVAHSSSWEIYTATFVMGIGIGLAFASMVNVIVESVSRRADGRRHRHERDLPQHRRRAGRPDLGQHPDRRRSPSAASRPRSPSSTRSGWPPGCCCSASSPRCSCRGRRARPWSSQNRRRAPPDRRRRYHPSLAALPRGVAQLVERRSPKP